MPNLEDTYFALLEGSGLSTALWQRVSRFYEKLQRTRTYWRWLLGYQCYYGLPTFTNPWDMTVIGLDGMEGELSSLQVNDVGNVGAHLVTMTTQSRPSWQVVTVNSDAKSVAQSAFVSGLLDYYLVHEHIEEHLFRAAKTAVACGTGYMTVAWDPRAGEVYDVDPVTKSPLYEGDLMVVNHMPWDCPIDLARRDSNHDWIFTRRLVSRWNLAARYPDLKDKILTADDASRQWLRDTRAAFTAEDTPDDKQDLLPVWTFYHKKTDACPMGRWAEFLNADILLGAGPLPYDRIPVLRVTAGEVLNTTAGDTPLHACLSLQDLLNRLWSSLATNNIAFGTQIIAGPDDAQFSRSELAEGMSYLALKPGPDGKLPVPQPLQLVASSPESYKLIDLTQRAIETLSGVNSVVRGDPAVGIKSGSYAALIQAQALQFSSDLQASYQRLIEGTGNLIIQHLKRFAKSKRLALIAGKSKAPMRKSFTSEDLNDIDRVMVNAANPVTKSPAFKLQMADTLLQHEKITTADEYLQVVETGNLSPLVEAKELSLLNIREENELLAMGGAPRALIIDDHRLHIAEHAGVLASPEMRGGTPEAAKAQQAVFGHIMEHINLWKQAPVDLLMALGFQPLPDAQPPMPPPGAPPAPPPGPVPPGVHPGAPSPAPTPGGPGPLPPPHVPVQGPAGPGVPQQQNTTGHLPKMPQMPMNPATGRRWEPPA